MLMKNNNNDNVSGAVIMTTAISSVRPVHLMNANGALGGRQPSDQANRRAVHPYCNSSISMDAQPYRNFSWTTGAVFGWMLLPSHR